MSTTKQDIEETARLILMDEPKGPKDFIESMRREVPDVGHVEATELWKKYRGLGVQLPTHDVITGRPTR